MAAADFCVRKPILLVGLMGAGKTTVGRHLAKRLGLPFADVDEAIEQAQGITIAELFAQAGEAGFRAFEREMLAGLLDGPVWVIAAGGGAFIDPDSRRMALARSIVVWLDAGVEKLTQRVGDGTDRPLLQGRPAGTALAELSERRRSFYREAHLRVSAEPAVDEVVESIVGALVAG